MTAYRFFVAAASVGLIFAFVISAGCKERPYDAGQKFKRMNEIPIQPAFAARCAIDTTSPAAPSFDALLAKSLAIACPRGTPWTVTSLLQRCNTDASNLRWAYCDGTTDDYSVDYLLNGPRQTR